jgi:hypothetical protein
MPNDAKLGLVLGVSLVVVIGMVFFRADAPANGGNSPPTTSLNSTPDPLTQGSTQANPLPN